MSKQESFWSTVPGILTALAGVITAVGSLVGALYSAGVIGRQENTQPRVDSQTATEIAVKPEPAAVKPESIAPRESVRRLRNQAAVLSNDAVNAMLVRHNFYDAERYPGGKGVAHRYEPQAIGDAVIVIDRATGLMWQQGGSDTMSLDRADDYIGRLNSARFAGFSDWHLPTLEEAMSLMEPQAYDGFHIAQVFAKGVNFIWAADRTVDGRGWVIYFYNGRLSSEKVDFNAWVRAVRSAVAGQ